VREGAGDRAADLIAHLKKGDWPDPIRWSGVNLSA